MSWPEVIAEALGSATGGGLVGGLLGLFSKREDRKLVELEHSHAQRMAAAQLDEIRLEGEVNIKLAQTEAQIAADVADSGAMSESLKSLAVSTGVKFVDAIRALVRPVVTGYLLVLSTALAMRVDRLVGGMEALPMPEIVELYRYIIYQLLALTSIAVGWWFASRASASAKNTAIRA